MKTAPIIPKPIVPKEGPRRPRAYARLGSVGAIPPSFRPRAGIQERAGGTWLPAFASMTERGMAERGMAEKGVGRLFSWRSPIPVETGATKDENSYSHGKGMWGPGDMLRGKCARPSESGSPVRAGADYRLRGNDGGRSGPRPGGLHSLASRRCGSTLLAPQRLSFRARLPAGGSACPGPSPSSPSRSSAGACRGGPRCTRCPRR